MRIKMNKTTNNTNLPSTPSLKRTENISMAKLFISASYTVTEPHAYYEILTDAHHTKVTRKRRCDFTV